MASQSGEYSELNFAGESAEEAQDFVQAVHKRAYAAGRQKDNAWIAEFACPFFARKALLWYETLDEDTQNDWKLLKRAILAEFCTRQPGPATVPSAAPASVSSLTSPTPAAPPPSAVTVKIGRVRVDSEDHTKSGYFYINPTGYGAVVVDSSRATIFEVDTLAQTLRFKGGGESLIMQGGSQNWSSSPHPTARHMYGWMRKFPAGSGPQWDHRWSITDDGSITVLLLSTDGSYFNTNFLVHQSFNDGVALVVVVDKDGFAIQNGKNWVPIKKAAPRKKKAAADEHDEPKPRKTRAPLRKKAEKVEEEDEDSAEEVKLPSDAEDNGEQESEEEKPKAEAKAKPAPKKKAPAKRKKKADSGDDDDDDDDEE